MLLRGRVIEYHNIARDLKYPEFIMYKLQRSGNVEGSVLTTIGFLKEAPLVNIHGFNVYHKNRLILPFWHVVSYLDSRGRGVVGVLEADFIEPTHNKQEFEKTPVFQKLENRLKEMTWEYWDYHCGLIGYQVKKKPRVLPVASQESPCNKLLGTYKPVLLSGRPSDVPKTPATKIDQNQVLTSSLISCRSNRLSSFQSDSHGAPKKSGKHYVVSDTENLERKARFGSDESVPGSQTEPATTADQLEDQESASLLQENQNLRRKCLESEKRHGELNHKLKSLMLELKSAQRQYAHLLVEARILDKVKKEKNVPL
ncbi:hypothetical protein LIER_29575 [Lithospermum erythrorhizon]|uniref:Morc S5 domain-containing protein n=1 Tax=Lithospermum erythrorhizon TaxID=34254 RepID=A0AAV3RN61_LITER